MVSRNMDTNIQCPYSAEEKDYHMQREAIDLARVK